MRNFLQLNENKTEVIMFGPPSFVSSLSKALGPISAHLHICTMWLKILSAQVSSVVKGSFDQLKTITKLKLFISHKDLETVNHDFTPR